MRRPGLFVLELCQSWIRLYVCCSSAITFIISSAIAFVITFVFTYIKGTLGRTFTFVITFVLTYVKGVLERTL